MRAITTVQSTTKIPISKASAPNHLNASLKLIHPPQKPQWDTPQSNCAVTYSSGNHCSIITEGYASDHSGETIQYTQLCTGRHVPQPDRSFCLKMFREGKEFTAAADHQVTIWAKDTS